MTIKYPNRCHSGASRNPEKTGGWINSGLAEFYMPEITTRFFSDSSASGSHFVDTQGGGMKKISLLISICILWCSCAGMAQKGALTRAYNNYEAGSMKMFWI